MKIYVYEDQIQEDLPTEEVSLEEDYPLDSYNNRGEKKTGDKNFREYDCTVHWGTYKRVKFERQYILKYYEVSSVEDFLVSHPGSEVLFHRENFFLRTWMD